MGACPFRGNPSLGCVPTRLGPPARPKHPCVQGPRLTMRQAIQLWAPAGCGLRTPRTGLLRKPEPGQSWRLWSRRGPWGRPGVGTLRKVPETTRKVAEASRSEPVPTPDPDLGSRHPTAPAPSWPAQRLPLCGEDTLDPRGQAGGGGWAEWHLQPHGVLGEFLRSSTSCAQGRQQRPPGQEVTVLRGEQGRDRLGGSRPSTRAAHSQAGQEGASGGTSTTRDGQTGARPMGSLRPQGPAQMRATVAWMAGHHVHTQTGRGGTRCREEWGSGAGGCARCPVAFHLPPPWAGPARPPPRVPPALPPIPELGSAAWGLSHSPNHLLPSFSKALS